ncbi:hypothetical protein MP228_012673 [Amoeboaphelidium protococcarum]|nr:hypothetical protein MP228_012673 [Amoeboaphelidium protococcarum]
MKDVSRGPVESKMLFFGDMEDGDHKFLAFPKYRCERRVLVSKYLKEQRKFPPVQYQSISRICNGTGSRVQGTRLGLGRHHASRRLVLLQSVAENVAREYYTCEKIDKELCLWQGARVMVIENYKPDVSGNT